MGEHAVRHVQPTVGPPGEAVKQLVAVFEAEAGLEDGGFVGLVIAVGVFKEKQVRRDAKVHAAIAQRETGGERVTVRKHGDLVRFPIGVGVFKDFDAVAASLSVRRAFGILVEFENPEPPALVPGHRDRVDHLRLAGEEAHFKPGWHFEPRLRLFGRQGRRVGGRVGAGELLSRGIVPVNREVVNLVCSISTGRGFDGQQKADEQSIGATFHRLCTIKLEFAQTVNWIVSRIPFAGPCRRPRTHPARAASARSKTCPCKTQCY